jgi:hypothetical protein
VGAAAAGSYLRRMPHGPRVLLIQCHVAPVGGGSGVAAWMIEALKADHRITLLTWHRPQLAAINRTFGSALAESDFEVRVCPSAVLRLLSLAPASLDLLKECHLMRHARRLVPDCDLSISAANEHDLGRRGCGRAPTG